MSFKPGPDAIRLQASVNGRQIRQIWHLTYRENLPLIFRRSGLLSRSEMDKIGVHYRMSSWGSEEKAEEMKDYICCGIVFPWGMARQDSEAKVFLALDPRLIWRENTIFSPKWSSFSDITLTGIQNKYTAEAFDSMFDNPTTNFPTPPHVEVLLHRCVSLDKFLPRLYFVDEKSRDESYSECRDIIILGNKRVKDVFEFLVNSYYF